MSYKPLSVVIMETIVEAIVGIGSVVALLAGKLNSDAATAIWGMILAYAFKNGYSYVNAKGQVINRGAPPEPSTGIGPG